MAGYRPAHEDIILFGEYFDDLQALHLHAIATHPARHTNALHDAAGVRRVTQRTGGPLTVMLTVRSLADTAKAMTLYDTLKTLTLRSTYDLDLVAFGEDVYSDGFT